MSVARLNSPGEWCRDRLTEALFDSVTQVRPTGARNSNCETRRVKSATLRALADVGTYPDDAGNVRLYHATSAHAAASILADMKLLPKAPDDPAERMLLRGHGYVYLASSSSIGRDLSQGSVVLAVDVAAEALPEEPLRAGWGESPRVELELKMPMSDSLPLAFVDRLD
jgi:hypothetical protein